MDESVVVVVPVNDGNSLNKDDVTMRYLNCSSNAVSSESGSEELRKVYFE